MTLEEYKIKVREALTENNYFTDEMANDLMRVFDAFIDDAVKKNFPPKEAASLIKLMFLKRNGI